METLELRPRRALLAIWITSAAVLPVLVGGGLAAIFASGGLSPLVGFLLGWLPPAGLLVAYLLLYFPTIRYKVDARHVSRESGVLWKVRRSVPLEKITSLDVREGPLERLLGFGRLWIFTPSTGAMLPEETLRGIADPHTLKQQILDRAAKAQTAPPGPGEATGAAPDADAVSLLRDMLAALERIEGRLGNRDD